MKKQLWIIAVLALLISSLACNAIAGGGVAPDAGATPDTGNAPSTKTAPEPTVVPAGGGAVEPTAEPTKEEAPAKYETEFPLPEDVSNFMATGKDGINFQTKMSLKDALAFYRNEFTKAGYKERQITTVINDTMFSLVFDGHASGKTIVIQAVDLGDSRNINLRFEDV